MKVGVIGAGAAGLAAAYELVKLGHQPVVYERAPFLGGQASTFDIDGARLERGYHHLFTGDTDILDLVREIGLGHQLRYVDSKVGTFYGGKIYDFVTPVDLMKFTPLSLVNRLRLGLLALRLRRMKDWRKVENVTADEWIRRNAGQSVYDIFWGPMLRGKFGAEYYKQVGMAWVWGQDQHKVRVTWEGHGQGEAGLSDRQLRRGLRRACAKGRGAWRRGAHVRVGHSYRGGGRARDRPVRPADARDLDVA